jgi:hypothetical protein
MATQKKQPRALDGPKQHAGTGDSPRRRRPRLSPIEAFLALSDEEKERVYQEVNHELTPEEMRPLTAAERALWRRAKKRMGRPKVGQGSKVVSVSIERSLLRRSDAYARSNGMSRAQLIAKGLELALKAAG